jgi:hypothetical protein
MWNHRYHPMKRISITAKALADLCYRLSNELVALAGAQTSEQLRDLEVRLGRDLAALKKIVRQKIRRRK